MASADDHAIAEAVIGGDRDAFRSLVEREADIVFRICYRVLRHPQEAEDAAQETFLSAYRALPTYRGEGSLRAWLARIATRHALRRRQGRGSSEPLEPLEGTVIDESREARPLQAALDGERRDELLSSVAALPDPLREVVVLKYFAELTLVEIADSTHRPVGTVKTHLHRALERLRRQFPEGAAS